MERMWELMLANANKPPAPDTELLDAVEHAINEFEEMSGAVCQDCKVALDDCKGTCLRDQVMKHITPIYDRLTSKIQELEIAPVVQSKKDTQ